ncbi:MAG: histidinol dehydrogenase [Nitrospirales bacterium]|nr:histidinol dehydrogenase [Nitrospirales bacterium]
MKIVATTDRGFRTTVKHVCERASSQNRQVEKTVKTILDGVARGGDAAVVRYVKRFDGIRLKPMAFQVPSEEIKQSHAHIRKEEGDALRYAAHSIRSFHESQRTATWFKQEKGIRLGQLITPLDAVGVYVPGGKALYPSSVLMNIIPAKVAGVKRVVMCTPTTTGTIDPYLLVAADIAQVDEVYRVGGVQAIGAMAFGTETIPRVDKIVGPGNQYVATAKRLVYGQVDIDMIAGPSELLVLADDTANVAHVASDLLCEAEHDEEARVYLVTTSARLAKAVAAEMQSQLSTLQRKKIASKSVSRYAVGFVVPDMDTAIDLSNAIAPEHLEIMVKHALDYLNRIRHAGAVFVGPHTPPSVADYVAGPNHVLPTGGSARFFSALSLDDFIKRTNVVCYNKEDLRLAKSYVTQLARMEGLEAHAKSIESRFP